MADPRRELSDAATKPPETRNSELEREERRLERLRLVKTERWPAAKPPVREADHGKGSGETGWFPQRPFDSPDPKQAA